MHTLSNFEIVRGLLPPHYWDSNLYPLPNLVVRHGINTLYGKPKIKPNTAAQIMNFGPGAEAWYLENFHHDPRYRFAGWAKLVNVIFYGLHDMWAEQLIPHPWYLTIIAFPGDRNAIEGKNNNLVYLPPANSYVLVYADQDGGRTLAVEAGYGDTLKKIMGGMETDPGPEVPFPLHSSNWSLARNETMASQIEQAISLTAPCLLRGDYWAEV